MKLTEIYNKPLKEILEECDIVNQQFHTDDDGNVKAIELKYKPKDNDERFNKDSRTIMR